MENRPRPVELIIFLKNFQNQINSRRENARQNKSAERLYTTPGGVNTEFVAEGGDFPCGMGINGNWWVWLRFMR
jgi:hypothetical protein